MDYDEESMESFTGHDLFSRVYVNDALENFTNGVVTSGNNNHIAYGAPLKHKIYSKEEKEEAPDQCVNGQWYPGWDGTGFKLRVEVWDEDSGLNPHDHLFRCALCHSHTATEHAAPALRTAPSTASGLADLLCSRVVSLLAPGTAAGFLLKCGLLKMGSATRSTSAVTATAVPTTALKTTTTRGSASRSRPEHLPHAHEHRARRWPPAAGSERKIGPMDRRKKAPSQPVGAPPGLCSSVSMPQFLPVCVRACSSVSWGVSRDRRAACAPRPKYCAPSVLVVLFVSVLYTELVMLMDTILDFFQTQKGGVGACPVGYLIRSSSAS